MKLIGALALGLLASLSVSADSQEKEFEALSAPNGRYVFGQVNPSAKSQYMLDTETGRLWYIVVTKEEKRILKRVDYEDHPFAYTYMPMSDKEARDSDNEFVEQRKKEIRQSNN